MIAGLPSLQEPLFSIYTITAVAASGDGLTLENSNKEATNMRVSHFTDNPRYWQSKGKPAVMIG